MCCWLETRTWSAPRFMLRKQAATLLLGGHDITATRQLLERRRNTMIDG